MAMERIPRPPETFVVVGDFLRGNAGWAEASWKVVVCWIKEGVPAERYSMMDAAIENTS